MNRRNVLIGLGGVVAGGGALLGTGAFTTVEAERTVSVETAGDADAFLALTPARGDGAFVDDSGDTVEINLDGTDSENDNADGLNQNAVTRFENLVDVQNNGTQDVGTLELEIEVTGINDDGAHEDAFKITVGDTTLDPTNGNPVGILGEGTNSDPLTPGETATFGIEIDLLNEGITEIDEDAEFTLTITAEADE